MTNPTNPEFLLIAAIVSLAIVLAFRRWIPGRRGLGLGLAILFGPAGHLYIRGGAPYIILMYIAWVGLLLATPLPPMVSGLLLTVLSAMLMNIRMKKAAEPPATQTE
jgi:hypothetical protein